MFSLVNFHETFYAISDGKQWTTSLNIAEVFGKNHGKIIRDIENLDCSQAFSQANFGLTSYVNLQNKEMPMYDITRDGFVFLAMGSPANWQRNFTP